MKTDNNYCKRMEKKYGFWWKKGPDDIICKSCGQSVLPEWGKEMSYTFKEAWRGPLQVDECSVSDIDWCVRSNGKNDKNNIMFIEQKNHLKHMTSSQIDFFGELDAIYKSQKVINYLGFYHLAFYEDYWHEGAVMGKLYFKVRNGKYVLDEEKCQESRKKITKKEFQEFLRKNF